MGDEYKHDKVPGAYQKQHREDASQNEQHARQEQLHEPGYRVGVRKSLEQAHGFCCIVVHGFILQAVG